MKTIKILLFINMLMLSLTLTTGCRRSSGEMLDDTRTAGRHMNRGVRSLGGKNGSSRQVGSPDEFYSRSMSRDYVPLNDDPNAQDIAMNELIRQPRETPGDPGSSVPGIDSFQDPSANSHFSSIFRNIHFAYNSSLIKGQENLEVIKNVADYLRTNPSTSIFVEGHCDERGPEAYNLALGLHRSNAVRNTLINEGVNPDNIFTISYGKERPLLQGHDEDAWAQNRRAEFKVYQR